jgi:dTDP-4-amino-4,6-dideoxygalactose transaminase
MYRFMKQKNIPLFKVYMSHNAVDQASQVLRSGYIGQGPIVDKFEAALSSWVGGASLVTLNSGTSALHLALHLAGVGPGDEVISTPLTCSATNTPILHTGANIVWADTDPLTCNIDIEDVIEKVSEQTKAIVFVHWGGTPVSVGKLKSGIIEKLGSCPLIIEDCAHAMGAFYMGKNSSQVGSSGNLCCFSFQAIKHLTSIDGGMLSLPLESLRKAKLLRWYGIDREEKRKGDFRCETDISEGGWKYHMNDVSAAVGLGNLSDLPEILSKHRSNGMFYSKTLDGVDGIELFDSTECSAFWLYTLKVERRADFIRMMKDVGIMTSRVHERNDIHSCFEKFKADLPKLDSINDRIVCIPVGWWVDEEERNYITEKVKGGW